MQTACLIGDHHVSESLLRCNHFFVYATIAYFVLQFLPGLR